MGVGETLCVLCVQLVGEDLRVSPHVYGARGGGCNGMAGAASHGTHLWWEGVVMCVCVCVKIGVCVCVCLRVREWQATVQRQ